MSEMHVPVTDAFDEPDHLESLEVELAPRQVEWLERKADKRGLSIDHMLRAIIRAEIRGRDEAPSSAGNPAPAPAGTDEDDSPSIVESLRSASERLQDLTEDDEGANESDLSDTLARLQSRPQGSPDQDGSSTERSGTVFLDDQSRSMFDMMEE